MKQPTGPFCSETLPPMESNLSQLSSLTDDDNPIYIKPHYKESYRLAIYALLCGGKEAYEEFLRAEQISHFLSDEEILFILENAQLPDVEDECEAKQAKDTATPSTYFPLESDEEVPDLELGWPEVSLDTTDTSISLLFNPPRLDTPTIKEVIRKQIQEARQVIAISMDVFTDVDIFKEVITATLRGVAVYILLDQSNFGSFLAMSRRAGINIQDLKNIRVRTVKGQQYRCQSGVKFNGDLEQKFVLIDCQTVLYGTYSYTWSFEKINLSMVLVITGQLVCSFDEEFRRLYARSTVPIVQSREKMSVQYQKDPMALRSPNSSHLSLHQIHMRSRGLLGIRGAQDDHFTNTTTMLTRGLSVQERLHQSHCPDLGNLVRGYSYGGDLQKLNSLARLRMGTKDLGASAESPGPNQRSVGDLLLPNRLSQQQLRHRTRYGSDQNLIPFNSETSLHRWKMDTYLKDFDMEASYDVISPVISPYSSYTGLNEFQSQLIHSKSRDIKTRMEEMRQKRLSLQEYTNLRQSQDIHRLPKDRPAFMSSLRGLDVSVTESESNSQTDSRGEPAGYKDSEVNTEGILTDGHRSTSYYDVKTVSDRKPMQFDWNEPLFRTTSAGDLDIKLRGSPLKPSNVQPSGLSTQPNRAMKSLTEIPEEKEGSNTRVNSPDLTGRQESLTAELQLQGQTKGGLRSPGKVAKSSGSAAPGDGKKSVSNLVQNAPIGSQNAVEATSNLPGKGQTQEEEPTFQRKNSLKMKMYSFLSSDEKKASKKEDKSLQRKGSLRLKNSTGLNQPLKADHSQGFTADHITRKGQSPGVSKLQSSVGGPAETEKQKLPFSRLSLTRSSKRKTNLSAEQDRGSGSTLDEEDLAVYQRQKVYSRFEYLLTAENVSKDRSASLSRHETGYPVYQAQSGSDKKLGRFMQRVGNFIGKNK